MTTVPANLFVQTNPSVLGVGGAGLVLSGMFLDNSTRVPIGTVAQFSSVDSVGDYFGLSSSETALAIIYFAGWTGSRVKPGNMVFTQYPTSAVGAFLRGGDISGITLATLQGYNGTLTIVINGVSYSGSVNLSGATSFSNAASLIATALNTSPPTEASFTAAISGTTMTVSAVGSGALGIGSVVTGAGVTGGTTITAFGTGTGGTGTYTVNASQSIASEAMTATSVVAVTYDSVSGGFVITSGMAGGDSTIAFPTTNALSTNLLLTSATGAVLSQGSAAATPSAFMTALASGFANWATFTTTFNPDGSGFANKLLFAEWVNGTNGRFVYSAWDIDPTAASEQQGTFAGLGASLQTDNLSGTVLNWASDATDALDLATFFMGATASIDFTQTDGRITFAFKSQTGLVPTTTDETSFVNLAGNPQVAGSFGNGYNCYAAIATANANFQQYQRGTISGPFIWADGYVNSIWLTNAMQVALMNLFAQANAIPFNNTGAGMLAASLQSVINQGLTFGAFAPGVTLTDTQVASVNAAAGKNISDTLEAQGYYLLIQPASAAVRANRGPWALTFFYVDSGSVQSVVLSTVALQ